MRADASAATVPPSSKKNKQYPPLTPRQAQRKEGRSENGLNSIRSNKQVQGCFLFLTEGAGTEGVNERVALRGNTHQVNASRRVEKKPGKEGREQGRRASGGGGAEWIALRLSVFPRCSSATCFILHKNTHAAVVAVAYLVLNADPYAFTFRATTSPTTSPNQSESLPGAHRLLRTSNHSTFHLLARKFQPATSL